MQTPKSQRWRGWCRGAQPAWVIKTRANPKVANARRFRIRARPPRPLPARTPRARRWPAPGTRARRWPPPGTRVRMPGPRARPTTSPGPRCGKPMQRRRGWGAGRSLEGWEMSPKYASKLDRPYLHHPLPAVAPAQMRPVLGSASAPRARRSRLPTEPPSAGLASPGRRL